MTMLENSPENDCERMESQISLFSAEDIHANHSPLPGSEEARRMTAISGQNIIDSYGKLGHVGLLGKMFLDTSIWGSTKCYLTWKTRVTPQKRLLFQLVPLTPTTGEIESGLLPTMTSMDSTLATKGKAGAHNLHAVQLSHLANSGALTTSNPIQTQNQLRAKGLLSKAERKLLPTPTSTDYKDSMSLMKVNERARTSSRGVRLPEHLAKVTQEEVSGSLNPQFVEWLMGYPQGWTDLKPLETP